MTASLEEATKKQRVLKAVIEQLRNEGREEPRAPTVDEIVALVLDVETRIKEDPTSAREALRKMLGDGKITLTPKLDGTYEADSLLILGPLMGGKRKPRSGGPGGASAASHDGVGNVGCAGRI